MTRETTQAKLKKLALKHMSNSGVRALMQTLEEEEYAAKSQMDALAASLALYSRAVEYEDGFWIGRNPGLTAKAATVDSSLHTISVVLATLAQVLQSLGEEVVY